MWCSENVVLFEPNREALIVDEMSLLLEEVLLLRRVSVPVSEVSLLQPHQHAIHAQVLATVSVVASGQRCENIDTSSLFL